MPSLPFSHLFLLLLLPHVSISSGDKRGIVDIKHFKFSKQLAKPPIFSSYSSASATPLFSGQKESAPSEGSLLLGMTSKGFP